MSDITEETGDARTYDEILADLNKVANRHRKERDALNENSKVWANKRDRINAQMHEKTAQAAVFKEKRDSCNAAARDARGERDRWNDAAVNARNDGWDPYDARSRADACHVQVTKCSADGQAYHEKIHQLYDEADILREQSEDAHKKYLICRHASDFEHEEYLKAMQKIHDFKNGLPE